MPSPRRCIPVLVPLILLAGCSPTYKERKGATPTSAKRQGDAVPPSPTNAAKQTPEVPGVATDQSSVDSPSATEKEATPSPETADALLVQADKAAKGGNLAEATRLLEKALAIEPRNRAAIFLLAVYLQARASELDRPQSSPLFIKSAAAIRTLREAYPALSPPEREAMAAYLYNEACTYAVTNEPDKALDTLAESIDAGLSQADLLAEDEELDAIRKLPRFAELTRKIEQASRAKASEKAKQLLAESRPFSFDFELTDVEGKTYKLGEVKSKVTVVDVWGTWCPPCRKEIPHLKELLAKFRGEGLAIVGINYERVAEEKIRPTIREFVKEQQIPYLCLIGDDKTREQIPNFIGYPTTLFLDGDGKVRATVVGYQSLVDLEAIVSRMLELPDQPEEQ